MGKTDKSSKKDKKEKKEKKAKKDLSESDDTEEVIRKSKEKVEVTEENWRPKQLFVSGIPYTATPESLKEFFSDFATAIG